MSKQGTGCKYCQKGKAANNTLFPSTSARYQFQARSGLMDYSEPAYYAGIKSKSAQTSTTPTVKPRYTNPLIIEDIIELREENGYNNRVSKAKAANVSRCCNYESGVAIQNDLKRCYPHLA